MNVNIEIFSRFYQNDFLDLCGLRFRRQPSPNPIFNSNPYSNPNPKAQYRFRTDEMTSFFEKVYRYPSFFYVNAVRRCSILTFWFSPN